MPLSPQDRFAHRIGRPVGPFSDQLHVQTRRFASAYLVLKRGRNEEVGLYRKELFACDRLSFVAVDRSIFF